MYDLLPAKVMVKNEGRRFAVAMVRDQWPQAGNHDTKIKMLRGHSLSEADDGEGRADDCPEALVGVEEKAGAEVEACNSLSSRCGGSA